MNINGAGMPAGSGQPITSARETENVNITSTTEVENRIHALLEKYIRSGLKLTEAGVENDPVDKPIV